MSDAQTVVKPSWLKIRPPTERYTHLKQVLREHQLVTVCEESHCPNMSECWSDGTATLMVMGDTCTRGCRFCHIASGKPKPLDGDEPQRIAEAVDAMGLRYVVLTSVARDDLPDQGATHIATCIKKVKEQGLFVEFLIPDMQGQDKLLNIIAQSQPHVLSHNLETVRRLTPLVRDRRATYDQSLHVLKTIKTNNPHIITKSSIMVGLGESKEELIQVMDDLRAAGVEVITFGQYLQPSKKQLSVTRYVSPEEFNELKYIAQEKGFLFCASGPFVRSSYKAAEAYLTHFLDVKSLRGVNL